MTTPRSRFRRHLSYANVMASIAVFVALGGGAYAAATISGNKLIKETVGGGKLKKGTITSTQVKTNSLTGSSIDESSLGTVPSAQTAQTAANATTATSAITATSAESATKATTAGSANTAKTADSATTADHAFSAETAAKAQVAGSADTAAEADTLDGLTAKQLQVTCPLATELYGGMCWDEDVRPAKNWIEASRECGNTDGRLPSLSELIAYVTQAGTQVSGHNWTGDVSGLNPGGTEIVFTSNEETTGLSESSPATLGYRCLFYRVN